MNDMEKDILLLSFSRELQLPIVEWRPSSNELNRRARSGIVFFCATVSVDHFSFLRLFQHQKSALLHQLGKWCKMQDIWAWQCEIPNNQYEHRRFCLRLCSRRTVYHILLILTRPPSQKPPAVLNTDWDNAWYAAFSDLARALADK